jgi:GWxTD domain-containing protein
MKRTLFLLPILLMMIQGEIDAANVNAAFNYSVFWSPQQGPYVETWLSVNASTVLFRKLPNSKFQGEVEILMLFTQNKEIVNFKKYNLSSQEVEDTANRNFSFLDQQRYLLPLGNYDLELSIRDVNSTSPAVESLIRVQVDVPSDTITLSSVQLVDRVEVALNPTQMTRGGYDLYPDFFAFYPASKDKITFYTEIYHTNVLWGAEGMFLISAFIESFETGKVISNVSYYKREKASEVVPFLHTFDICQVPSGNFNVVVEVRDKENKVVGFREVFFQRSNPGIQMKLEDIDAINVSETFASLYTSLDSLKYYVSACMPLASDMERTFALNLIENKDVHHLQQYLYHFWYIRDPGNPQLAWLNYKVQVEIVNMNYSTFIKNGYETDRGRIFLKYGAPNATYKSTHEPEAYPYEIWHYYKLTSNQTNRKFVFISTDLGSTDFELAHSNATGEMNDPQWHLKLYARNVGGTNVDRTEYDTNYGSKALEMFNNPY